MERGSEGLERQRVRLRSHKEQGSRRRNTLASVYARRAGADGGVRVNGERMTTHKKSRNKPRQNPGSMVNSKSLNSPLPTLSVPFTARRTCACVHQKLQRVVCCLRGSSRLVQMHRVGLLLQPPLLNRTLPRANITSFWYPRLAAKNNDACDLIMSVYSQQERVARYEYRLQHSSVH